VTDGNGGLNSDGYMFYVKVDWNAGPGAGFSNSWPGRIGDDSSLVGTTTNNTVNNWQAWAPVFCTEPPHPGSGADPRVARRLPITLNGHLAVPA
jgi:hypothetical protein